MQGGGCTSSTIHPLLPCPSTLPVVPLDVALPVVIAIVVAIVAALVVVVVVVVGMWWECGGGG